MQAIETLTYTHLVIPIKTIVKTKRNGLSIFVLVNYVDEEIRDDNNKNNVLNMWLA